MIKKIYDTKWHCHCSTFDTKYVQKHTGFTSKFRTYEENKYKEKKLTTSETKLTGTRFVMQLIITKLLISLVVN
jgi:hypothetical protein